MKTVFAGLLLASTWHPAASNDLKPLRAKADSLAAAAKLWSESKAPAAELKSPFKHACVGPPAANLRQRTSLPA